MENVPPDMACNATSKCCAAGRALALRRWICLPKSCCAVQGGHERPSKALQDQREQPRGFATPLSRWKVAVRVGGREPR